MSWYGSVAYCNWLTEKHGLGADQCCYGGYLADGGDRWGVNGADYHPDRTGYRLATDAEWEYACRINRNDGTVSTDNYFWGPDLDDGSDDENWKYLWFGSNSNPNAPGTGNNHQIVGTTFPNGIGLYDMSGNVWERIGAWFGGAFPYDEWNPVPPAVAYANPKGPKTGGDRVLRGGCWGNNAGLCQSGLRFPIGGDPENRSINIGFRLVRTR